MKSAVPLALCCALIVLPACSPRPLTLPSLARVGGLPDTRGGAFYVSPSGADTNAGTLAAPFLTPARAQSAMRSSSAIKTTYIRAGRYSNIALRLSSADSGETWSYYPSDGYDTAILDGGSSSGRTGGNPFTLDGASNVTINGFTIQNFRYWGVGVHGGMAYADYGFPRATPNVADITIINNIFLNGHDTLNNGWIGAINAVSQVENLTVSHNVIQNVYGMGVSFWTISVAGSISPPYSDQNNLDVDSNVVLNVCTQTPDCGAIYRQDTIVFTTGVRITNNFIRDYQGNISGGSINNSGDGLKRAVAIYLDQGSSNTTITGNVIASTANAIINSQAIGGTTAIELNQSSNVAISGNIIDLGRTAQIVDLAYADAVTNAGYRPSDMTGNSFTGNIIIGNWSGAQHSYFFGVGPYAFLSSARNPAHPALQYNLYYNYGSGSLSTAGNFFSDAAPVTNEDPLISGTTYTIAAGSPAYSPPVNFPPILGGWGPPGYVIPASGTFSSTR